MCVCVCVRERVCDRERTSTAGIPNMLLCVSECTCDQNILLREREREREEGKERERERAERYRGGELGGSTEHERYLAVRLV